MARIMVCAARLAKGSRMYSLMTNLSVAPEIRASQAALNPVFMAVIVPSLRVNPCVLSDAARIFPFAVLTAVCATSSTGSIAWAT